MGELFAAALQVIAIFGLDRILNGTRNGIIDTQDGALNKLDLAGGIPPEVATAISTAGCLSLAPSLNGRSLAAGVR